MTKLSIDIACKIAEEREGKCLSTEYIRARNHLQWQCKNGHKWFATLSHVRNKKTWCPTCKCLSTEYINSKTPMQWKCEKGHQWFARMDSIRNHNTWCLKCRHHSIETAKEIAYNRNGKCLSIIYKDNKTPLQWKCNKGHIWIAHLNSIKDCNNWCPYCRGFNKTIKDMHKLAQKRNGKCLSEKYEGAHTKLQWQCNEGHIWITTPNCILKNHWCPYCLYKHENLCRKIVTNLLGKPFEIRRPNFLKTDKYPKGLELDIYYPQYGFAIEVQGIQHECQTDFFHQNLEKFKNQLIRDQDKKELCDENDIALVEIWYYEDPYKVISKYLQNLGIID
ncbi:hypothetical protein Glove_66g24 [Diversispora epigaea]|uniref:Zinc-ribbon domain-containing protein n=1 Tax=Diversispora epigaea TaxID=1348612 RepID=A0A397JAN3_9GLOM|nr:hypothetical protein Glove_66g24 [Diversispora epigaea]